MKRYLGLVIIIIGFVVSCTSPSDYSGHHKSGILVVDSIFVSVYVDSTMSDYFDQGIHVHCRLIYHFEGLDGTIQWACVSVEDPWWGTTCSGFESVETRDAPLPKGVMFEHFCQNCGAPRYTEKDSIDVIVKIESVFWKRSDALIEERIIIYNDDVWIDTIRTQVQRYE